MSVVGSSANPVFGARSPLLPANYVEPRWYAAYTNANHERRVADQLSSRGVEHFLPSYPSVRQWKDRRVQLELPLFPGYVFLRLALCDRLQVLQIPSLARLVGFGDMPVALDNEEINSLRRAVTQGVRLEPHPFLKAGRRVRITSGPLAGREGVLKRWKGKLRVLLSIDLIQRSVLVDVDASWIASVHASGVSSRAGS